MLKQFLWNLLFCLLFHEAVHAFPITMGLEFAVALPRIMDKGVDTTSVLFILTTFHTDEFEVQFLFNNLTTNISVSKMTAGQYLLPDEYELDVQVGPKPSYHFVSDVFLFGLTVHMFNVNVSASSLLALPISAWGRQYYTVNLRGMPSYQVVSSNDRNYVTIKISLFLSNFTISYNNTVYKNKDTFKTELQMYEAFAISACADDTYQEGDVSRTRIYAESPVGVVSGNCLTVSDTYTCDQKDKVEKGDTWDGTAEMLMPSDYFGTEFIVMALPYRLVPGKVIISSPNETSFAAVNLSIGFNESVRTFYVGVTDSVHRSGCLKTDEFPREEYGDVTFSTVVPTSLYYVAYVWRNADYTTMNYAVLIAPKPEVNNLHLNTKPLGSEKWENVAGTSMYQVCHLQIPQLDNIIKSSPIFKFGCYLYGYSPGTAYMHPAGFQDCKLSGEKHFMDDNIDNDCDGLTDEETTNGKDDDGDTLIDEDLRIVPNADGEWSAWKSWTCFENCSYHVLHRRRLCDHPPPQGSGKPCQGPDEEFSNVTCVPKMTCPETVCPKSKWGPSCLWDCSHCSSKCDRLNGSCNFCESGWKNSKHGCNEECGFFEWGENCLYNCYETCWADCVDRETGACSPVTWAISALSWILCFVFIIATIIMRNKKRKRKHNVQAKVSIEVSEEKPEPQEIKLTKRQSVNVTSKETL